MNQSPFAISTTHPLAKPGAYEPAGCHHNPNQSPVSFHIRKVQSRYLKPYTKLLVMTFVTFNKMVGALSVHAGVQ